MTTMFTTLDVPELPKWADNGTYIDEPPEADKLDGFKPGYKPPAKWFNWAQNLCYEWSKQTFRMMLSNWSSDEYGVGAHVTRSIIHRPDSGNWIITDFDTNKIWVSKDGHYFAASTSFISNDPQERSIAIDSTYTLFGMGAGKIDYVDGALTMASIAAATIGGGTGDVVSIITKYPTSDFTMCMKDGLIYIAASGLTGAWTVPTTQPVAAPVLRSKIIWRGGDVFYVMTSTTGVGTTKTYVSSDNGDTWAATATNPFTADDLAEDMAHNPDNDMLVVVGHGTASAHAEYSEDLGATWVSAAIDYGGVPASFTDRLSCVYYCGNGFWVAGGHAATTGMNFMLISEDGKKWSRADIRFDGGGKNSVDIHASTQKVISLSAGSGVAVSLSNGSCSL